MYLFYSSYCYNQKMCIFFLNNVIFAAIMHFKRRNAIYYYELVFSSMNIVNKISMKLGMISFLNIILTYGTLNHLSHYYERPSEIIINIYSQHSGFVLQVVSTSVAQLFLYSLQTHISQSSSGFV